ncbi:uncharacterized protein LOC134776734 [Penaeus indicus]|uniref:uncharacterized protein LOC134776734 n=1 Tax=Penaeus indicus TaxID=29960 RepID=UPI00300D220F
MSVKLAVGKLVLNVICAHAPQVGCSTEEKDEFWQQLDVELQALPQEERVFLGGDLNGHLVLIVVLDCEVKSAKRGKQLSTPKIKWWKLKEEHLKVEFKEKVMREVTSKEDTNEWWEENSKVIRRVAEEVLGKTSGKGMPQGKDTWWWCEEVQVKIKEKKEARRRFETSSREEDRAAAKSANKEAQAQAKARVMGKIYEELETTEGQKNIYLLAKRRNRATKDFTQIKQVKDGEGRLLSDENEIRNRWKVYFEKLLNEENEKRVLGEGTSNERETPEIETQEVKEA